MSAMAPPAIRCLTPGRCPSTGRSALFRPRHRARSVGQEDRHHRQQRVSAEIIQCSTAPSTRRFPARPPISTLTTFAARSRPERAYLRHRVNNGVHAAGFATTQDAYSQSATLFETLDMLEDRLGKGRHLFGDRLTEADWRLFTTLVVDPVYVGHFKCNIRRIADYPNLSAYLRQISTRRLTSRRRSTSRHIKDHYYRSHKTINPTGIVPVARRRISIVW